MSNLWKKSYKFVKNSENKVKKSGKSDKLVKKKVKKSHTKWQTSEKRHRLKKNSEIK